MPINIVDDATLQYAELTFHYANDRDAFKIYASLHPWLGWFQWGQPSQRMTANTALMEALNTEFLASLTH